MEENVNIAIQPKGLMCFMDCCAMARLVCYLITLFKTPEVSAAHNLCYSDQTSLIGLKVCYVKVRSALQPCVTE